jgi:ATP-dependent RNA helicase DDX21
MEIMRGHCKRDIQVCLFSATIPTWIKQVCETFLRTSYKLIDLAQNLKNKTAANVNHFKVETNYADRLKILSQLRKFLRI